MESENEYGLQLLNMLPPFLQSRLPALPARLRSLGSAHLPSNAGGTGGAYSYTRSQQQHCEVTATFPRNNNNDRDVNTSGSSSSSSRFSDSSSSSSSASLRARRTVATATSVSSVLARQDKKDEDDPISGVVYNMESGDWRDAADLQYDQLLRHFVRSVREMDNRRQLDNGRLLEGDPQQQQLQLSGGGGGVGVREQRLPHSFNGHSHDAVDRRWSPSGIKWRYARQGAQLATDASEELQDASFERSAYIDAVAYYLRACPDQLDAGETAKILSAAPWLAAVGRPEDAPRRAGIARPTDRGRPFLFDAVQWAVAALVLLSHMLWCFLVSAARAAAYLEREHQLSGRLASGGFDIVNSVGRHSVAWTARIQALNDGPLGQVVSWTMDSVTGGIQEGYGRGMDRIRQQQQQQQSAGEGRGDVEGDIVEIHRR